MKKLVGLPVQEAAIEYGQPVNVMDMPDGRRVFQFQSQRTAYMPATANTQGSVWGNTWNSTTQVYGGHPVNIECTYTFYTAWDDSQGAWMVVDYKVPKRLIC